MRLLLFALVAVLGACTPRTRPSAECRVLVDKILVCDPTAAGVPRSSLEAQCVQAQLHCSAIDAGTADGCAKFMGCLYDG